MAGAHETDLDKLKTMNTLVLTFNIYYCYDSPMSKSFLRLGILDVRLLEDCYPWKVESIVSILGVMRLGSMRLWMMRLGMMRLQFVRLGLLRPVSVRLGS